jgi:predicted transcriptional regulator
MATTLAPGKTIVSAVIDEEQRDELIRLARAADRSLSAEVRRAVTEHLERSSPIRRNGSSQDG